MKNNQHTDISIEQIASLARDAGVSIREELPDPIRKAMDYGRRSTDDAGNKPLNAINQFFESFRF